LTATEIAVLDRLVNDKLQARRKNLKHSAGRSLQAACQMAGRAWFEYRSL
jgi:hypothetical protein